MAFVPANDSKSVQSHPLPTGILIVNIGTPATPEPGEIRKYLREFLSDRRVIRWPRWLWLPLLHLIILRVRPEKVASKYKEIWTEGGSPQLRDSLALADGLERKLQREYGIQARVVVGMRYGHPSIRDGLRVLRDRGAQRLIILPLFPQYSHVTVASAYDVVFDELRSWRWMPEVEAVRGYHLQPMYIHAITQSIEAHWQVYGKPDRLLISYHGIPQSYVAAGDPYPAYCQETTERIVEQLDEKEVWIESSFQSRFGPQPWTQPYSETILAQWGQDSEGRVDVICPGFAIDCLETLHEIAIEARELYQGSGGEDFHYIPALNTCQENVELLADIIRPHLQVEQSVGSLLAENSGDEV
jgi:ferrochelatase